MTDDRAAILARAETFLARQHRVIEVEGLELVRDLLGLIRSQEARDARIRELVPFELMQETPPDEDLA